jgi:RNA polymerase sigma-70 factor (ECF subfamily)
VIVLGFEHEGHPVIAPQTLPRASTLALSPENGFPPSLVLRVVIVGATYSVEGAVREGRLVAPDVDTAASRFLQMAEHELHRSYRFAGLMLGDAQEAEDATQDALLRAWRSAPSLRDPAGFQAWFDRILINVSRDRLRRRGRVRFIPLDSDSQGASVLDPFQRVLARDEMLRAMAALDDDHRLVLVLHYWADLTLEDVAERVGSPIGTVKSRLHRGLATMRTRLDRGPVSEVRR